MDKFSFQESQRFNQPWIKILLTLTAMILLIVDYNQFQKEILDQSIFIFSIIPITIGYFVFVMKLKTSIDASGIRYTFFPLFIHETFIPWSEIAEISIRKYNPLVEYGGWGIRLGLFGKGRAFNVRGNQGIQLVLKNGKRILIGTQKPHEVKSLLEGLKK